MQCIHYTVFLVIFIIFSLLQYFLKYYNKKILWYNLKTQLKLA